jgi:hypothetical protein
MKRLLVVGMILGGWLYAGENADNAAPYMKMGVGVRPLGLGGAFVAVSDDASAGFWNPAGLSQIEAKEVAAVYGGLAYDRSFHTISLVQPLAKGGFGATYLRVGLEGYDVRDGQDNLKGEGNYGVNSMLISYGCALDESKKISGGVSFKIIRSSLDEISGTRKSNGFGLDVGALVKIGENLKLGAVVADINTKEDWEGSNDDKSNEVPIKLKMGIASSLADGDLLLASDFVRNLGEQFSEYHFGMEYTLASSLKMRGGVSFKTDKVKHTEWAVGGSYILGLLGENQGLSLDYAYTTGQNDLDLEAHRLGVSLKF